MSSINQDVPVIRTIKATRGDALVIDLGKTFLGTLTAWMKKEPTDGTYRAFEIVDNRYLKLSQDKTVDYYDDESGKLIETVGGRWFWDVEQLLEGQDSEESKTIYKGSVLFENDITNTVAVESIPGEDIFTQLKGKENKSEKGKPDGYAPLNSDNKIPEEYLPTPTPTGVEMVLGSLVDNTYPKRPVVRTPSLENVLHYGGRGFYGYGLYGITNIDLDYNFKNLILHLSNSGIDRDLTLTVKLPNFQDGNYYETMEYLVSNTSDYEISIIPDTGVTLDGSLLIIPKNAICHIRLVESAFAAQEVGHFMVTYESNKNLISTLQQITSSLVDADGYAETTDGIKASKLKVGGFGAEDGGFYYKDYDGAFRSLEYTEGSGLKLRSEGSATIAYILNDEIGVGNDEKGVFIDDDGLNFFDIVNDKKLSVKFPVSIVGTDKIVQWRDLSGTPALLSDIPTADDLGAEKLVNKGVSNGYAPLNSSTKIDTVFLPDSVLGQMVYGGLFNASTAVATLTNNAKTRLGTASATISLTNDTTAITGYLANEGIYYISSVAGTFAGLSIDVGDWLLSIGTGWAKIDNTDAISSFNGRTGAIVLIASDVADLVHAATSKTTIVDADEIGGTNSATSFSLIRITALNFYNYLKGKFDLVYTTTSAVATQITTALASFKTANFLDATSSIQSQIDGKLSESDVNIFCDFNSTPSNLQFAFYENFYNSKNNTGHATTATNAPIVDTSNMGVWYLKAGVGVNYFNLIGSGEANSTLNQLALSLNISSYETFIYLDNLTDSSNFISGFINQVLNTAQTNGCYFLYNPNANSGRIQCITVNSGTATTTSLTGITVTNKWFKFKVVATSTSVLYYVDGSLVATHTTNIPTARMGYGFGINNITVGATTVGIYADFFRAKFKNLR